MPLTLGLAGMDPATEAALKAAFLEAHERDPGRWQLLPETQADHIVVDMDSMYGPMSWLRLHASGKCVIGLTSAPRAQTDFRLGRPFSTESVLALLQEIGGGSAHVAIPTAGSHDTAALQPPAPVEAPSVPAPLPAAEPAQGQAPAPLASAPPPAAAAPPAAAPVVAPAPAPAPEPEPEPAVAEAGPRTLFDWLSSGRLQGRLRYRRASGPTLLVDTGARSYHGPTALKPLAQYFEGEVADTDFDSLDQATWDREAAAAGAAQPLARLVWLGALGAGGGRLLPGVDPEARFLLNRWPQIEREFPRHFRIATAMMKGPAPLAEVAEASGIALEEIVDFVNASLATGVAEVVVEPSAQPVAQARTGGLLGRLRGR